MNGSSSGGKGISRFVLGFPRVISAAAPSAAPRFYRLPWHQERFGNHSLSEFVCEVNRVPISQLGQGEFLEIDDFCRERREHSHHV